MKDSRNNTPPEKKVECMCDSIYNNNVCDKCCAKFGEDGLDYWIKTASHDLYYPHEKEYFEQIIQGKIDGRMKRAHFKCWKTKSCGRKDCHHPQIFDAFMQTQPYKITWKDL